MMASSSSSNLSDHLLQDDPPRLSLPFAPNLHSTIGANHQWSQPLLLDQITSDELEVLLSAQGHHHSESAAPTPPQLSSVIMMQELGFQWSNCAVADASMAMLISQQDSHTIKAEEELPAESLTNPRSSCGTTIAYNDTFYGAGLPPAALDGVVLPSVNVSRLQKPCPAAPPLPGDAFEILASARLCKTLLSQASSVFHNGMPSLREQHVPYGPPAHLQGPSIDNYKISTPIVSGNNSTAGGGSPQKAASSSKKPGLLSRSSTIVPSFKVRKEKLGDRIAALQQLVSPFGKNRVRGLRCFSSSFPCMLLTRTVALCGGGPVEAGEPRAAVEHMGGRRHSGNLPWRQQVTGPQQEHTRASWTQQGPWPVVEDGEVVRQWAFAGKEEEGACNDGCVLFNYNP